MVKKINILQHILVPAHRIIVEGEVTELLQKYNIKKLQLPKILENDPIIKKIGAKAGNIIEITRKSQTAGQAKYYRVVINE